MYNCVQDITGTYFKFSEFMNVRFLDPQLALSNISTMLPYRIILIGFNIRA